jgi:hypothetical protein
MEWNLGQDSAVRWSREEWLDPAPYWELATGRPMSGKLQSPVASPNELLRFKNAVYQRQNGVWRSPDGQNLPELPDGYTLLRFSPDFSHALVLGPMEAVPPHPEIPAEFFSHIAKSYDGLFLFRVDPEEWTQLAGTMYGEPEDAPAARFVPDHRAVQIEGAWAYRFRPEHCRLWFPATGFTVQTGPSGSRCVGPERWIFTDDWGVLCACSSSGEKRRLGEIPGLEELNQIEQCAEYVVTGGTQACIWNQDLKQEARLDTGLVWDLCAGGQGKSVVTRSQTHLCLWSVPEGKLLFKKEMTDPEDCRFELALHLSAAGDWFFVSRFHNTTPEIAWCWALNGITLEERHLHLPKNVCRHGAKLLPDGRLLVLTRDDRWSLYSGQKWELCAQLETKPSGGWIASTPAGDYDVAEGEKARGKRHVAGLWASVWQGAAPPPPAKKRGWLGFFG